MTNHPHLLDFINSFTKKFTILGLTSVDFHHPYTDLTQHTLMFPAEEAAEEEVVIIIIMLVELEGNTRSVSRRKRF